MDGVSGEGIEWHCRSSQLDRPRRESVDVGNANIGTECEAQTGTPGAKQELIGSWQAWIAPRDAEN